MPKRKNHQSAFTRSLFDSELPEDWRLVPVGDALRGTQYGLSEPGDSNGNTPIVGMRDLNNGSVNLIGLATVDDGGADWTGMQLRRGDILLNRTNSADLVGKAGIVREDSKAVFASYLVRLDVDREKADPEYLNYWLNTAIAQTALKRLSTRGVSQANINPTEFRKHCPLPLPPLPEQRKIAEILRTWDEAIEKLKALRAAKERRLTSLREKLTYVDAEGEPIRLGDVTEEVTTRNGDGRLDRKKVMGVTNSRGIVPMREQTIAEDISRYKVVPHQAFAYNPMRINVGSIAMNEVADAILVSPDYVVFACLPDQLSPDFLDHLRNTKWWAHYINSGGSGSVRQRTYYADLAAMKVPLPDFDRQRRIADILNTARRDVEATTREITVLQRQKRGLMQKLLTGEWRVAVDSPPLQPSKGDN